ncbi:sodium/hydrogen exchanger 9-like [Oscarella lobularis]|uniref:sodium/hydrogen exchanger 9-like n=1 Tax=Oscarella lobularis TaxID=121494 RepID=UPI0033143F31
MDSVAGRRRLLMLGLLGLLACSLVPSSVAEETEIEISEKRQEEEAEKAHRIDSQNLLLLVVSLVIVIVIIWFFRIYQWRVLHETGLALVWGILLGALIRYVFPGAEQPVTIRGCSVDGEQGTENVTCDGNSTASNATGDVCESASTFLTNVPKKFWIVIGNATFSYSLNSEVFKTKGSRSGFEEHAVFDPEVFFYVLLPPIIFFAGYDMKKRYFFRNIGGILTYAFLGTSISCFAIGGIMYGYIKAFPAGIPEGFDFIECLLFGALISATDPVTVLAIFHDMHVDVDLFAFTFGESVMNDAVAIVLYSSIKAYSPVVGSITTFQPQAFFKSLGVFIGIFLGSFAIGVAVALASAIISKFTKIRDYPLFETGLFTMLSYSSFLMAEAAGLTGIVAVLFCGVAQAHYTFFNLSEESRVRTKQLFEVLNFLAENFIFVYMGLSLFTFRLHKWIWGFISFSFLAILVGRLLNIYPLSFFLNLGRKRKIPWSFQHMLSFAGLRGAIAFSLAMRNTESEPRQLILTTTLMIVFVTVFVNGGLTTLALQFFKIEVGVEDDEEEQTFQAVKTTESNEDQPTSADVYEKHSLPRFWKKFDSRYIRPIFTSIGALPSGCPSFMQKISKGRVYSKKSTEGLLDDTEEQHEEDLDLTTAALSFRNDNFDAGEGDGDDDLGAGDLGLGDAGEGDGDGDDDLGAGYLGLGDNIEMREIASGEESES